MDIVGILSMLKDKVLDLKDIELLKNAYDLQEENITQLKTSNEIFRENIALQKEKIRSLELSISDLTAAVESLQADRASFSERGALISNAADCLTLLAAWLSSLTTLKAMQEAYRFSELDTELGLESGSAKLHLVEAVKKTNFVISSSGPETFKLSLPPRGPRVINLGMPERRRW